MGPTDAEAQKQTEPSRNFTVCTGNVCRLPMAERLLQAGLDERPPGQFVVESASTGALAGKPVGPRVAGFVRDLGGTADEFVARQLTAQILEGQDLVLALSRAHRGREMSPELLRKNFTLREFARLLPSIAMENALQRIERWRAALPTALPSSRYMRVIMTEAMG